MSESQRFVASCQGGIFEDGFVKEHELATHQMWNSLLVLRDGLCENKRAHWNLVRVFTKRSIVEIPENEPAKSEWAERGTNRYPAILILAEGQMGIWMMNIHELSSIVAEVETDRKGTIFLAMMSA